MQNKVELTGIFGDDATHALSAWTSTNRDLNDDKMKRIPGLLKFLAENDHHTPFEKSYLQFLVTCEQASHIHQLKHRIAVCVSGDTEVWTETISPNSGRTVRKRKIKDLYQRWHFGVVDKPHQRHGRKFDSQLEQVSSRIRLLPASKNQSLRVLNEDNLLFELSRISDIYESGTKQLIQLSTKNNNISCTPEHRIFTENGWQLAGDLKYKDKIAITGIVGVGEPVVPKRLRQGIGIWTQRLRSKLISELDICYVCNDLFKFSELDLDHVIPVYKDLSMALSEDNLKPICKACHQYKTSNFEQVQQTRTASGAKFVPLISSPKELKEEITYDLSVDGEFNNFVANGIVVHNSVNGESARYKEFTEDKWYIPDDWDDHLKNLLNNHSRDSFNLYHYSLNYLEQNGYSRKRAKESARFFLPFSSQITLDIAFNFRSFMAFQKLRNDEHAQLEINNIAEKMLQLVKDSGEFNASLDAFGY